MASQLYHNNYEAPLTLSLPPATTTFSDPAFVFQRKTPFQLQTLEYLYADDKNPTESRLKDYASALGLSYEQVRRWYIGRHRRDEQNAARGGGGKCLARSPTKAKSRFKSIQCLANVEPREDLNYIRRPGLVQDMLYSPDYILNNIFRKDGPPLGIEFDSLPSTAFPGHSDVTDNRASDITVEDEDRAPKRRKVRTVGALDIQSVNQTKYPKKHGKGKGLMSAGNLMNFDAIISDSSFPDNAQASKKRKVLSSKTNPPEKRHGMGKGLMMGRQALIFDSGNSRKRRPQRRKPVTKQKRSANKLQVKRKPSVRQRKVQLSTEKTQKVHRDICRLALTLANSEPSPSSFFGLADDEELELRELQAGPNALACSSHSTTGGNHGCSLCKGLLPKFPPNFVSMRKPLPKHPLGTSLKLEKKLFKVFHFLYTYAAILDLCPFTLDEFTEAFIEKESLLLGKLHICLLQLLLSDVEKELTSEMLIHSNKNGMFLKLLNTTENRRSIVNYWKISLNALTWTEILRQVMVAAAFGPKDVIQKKGSIDKGAEHMVKYGLQPGTLKAELFNILLEKGNTGMKVIELAESSKILDLGLGKADCELQDSICSTLAGDITLFEKISASTYRLRPSSILKEDEDAQSDNEGCISIDDESRDCVSGNPSSILDIVHRCDGDNGLNICTEIDESHQGESWLLGLMEAEYSDLSIDEKLNALLALVDLLSAGSSLRMKDSSLMLGDCVPKIYQHGSGGKIKRSAPKELSMLVSSGGDVGENFGAKNGYQSSEFSPVDSSVALSVLCDQETPSGEKITCLHPMQSIFLGSDRRFNRYWLFLGPCDVDDPGHACVYFESSEDGHWQVIDSEEALCCFVGVLNGGARREAALLESLQKRMGFILDEMSSRKVVQANAVRPMQSDVSEIDRVNEDSPSPVSDIDNNLSVVETQHRAAISSDTTVIDMHKKAELQKQTYDRLQAYDSWIWDSLNSVLGAVKRGKKSYMESLTRCRSCHDLYWRDERHCKTCHTTFELDFDLEEKYAVHLAMCQSPGDIDMCPMHKVLPSRLQALKAAVHAIELLMPEDALIGAWKKSAHKLWARRLRRTSSLHELLQVLADFVGAINLNWMSQQAVAVDCVSFLGDAVARFRKIPQTSSAVALWLVNLDSLIMRYLNERLEVVIL